MKPNHLATLDEIEAEELAIDPEYRREWERTALARAVALRLVDYRAQHGLSVAALARQLGMARSMVVRLESGDADPSIETLRRLASALGVAFHIAISADAVQLTA